MKRSEIESRLQAAFAQEPVGVVSAYLFGSNATETAHRESDVDVGVLLDRRRYPTARARFEQRLGFLTRLSHALSGAAVDVVILNEAPARLARRIVLDGTPLFCSDPDTDRAFQRDVQLLAADLEPFLRRTGSLKLAALAR